MSQEELNTQSVNYVPTTKENVQQIEQRKTREENAYVLMDEIVERLKLLDYEEKFKPLTRLYFAEPNKSNPTEQFHTFIKLYTWLTNDKLGLKILPIDLYDDPNTIATNLSM